MNIIFEKIKHIHFIGIGGIGISALARLFLKSDKEISGTEDNLSAETLDGLREQGVNISLDLNPKSLPEADCYIYSIAWLTKHSEVLKEAEARGVPCYTYPEALGIISKGMRTVAVSGTHGKTTTTAMIAEVLISAQKSPTVIVGSLLKSGTNFVHGDSDIFVVEACEYKRSFLNLSPEILVITNIDNDHLDYYKDISDIQSAFHELAMKVPAHGFIVADMSNENTKGALDGVAATIIDCSFGSEASKLALAVPGEHNVMNAKAALAVALLLGVSEADAVVALNGFQGTWRRQEYKGTLANGVIVYDDYAHHPTEIKATLQGFRSKFPAARIRVVFQPHLYSRTKLLLNDFAGSFADANEVIVAPIYAARETPDGDISAEILAQAIIDHQKVAGLRVWAMSDFLAIETYLRDTAEKNDMIITMGAGDVHKVGEELLK